ncbi:molecular chaperone [Dionaea muscipula]
MRNSQREKLLLGYSAPESSLRDPDSSPVDPNKVPDVDFSDVFGGPPRRFSFQDIQQGVSSDNNNRYDGNSRSVDAGDDDDDDDDNGYGTSLVSGYPLRSAGYGGGKPVFGDEVVSRRRHRVSKDFFDDIFGGGQSTVSSPKMVPRDPFCSSPGSRLLSPVRPLPPRPDPIGSFTQFSLPARLANTDLLAAVAAKCSPYRTWDGVAENTHPSTTLMSRFSTQSIQIHDVLLQGDGCSTSHRSPLSSESSLGLGEPKLDGVEVGFVVDQDVHGLKYSSDSGQFHFSIHKWASKGVPLFTSLRRRSGSKSKENNKIERSTSSNGRVGSEPMEGKVCISNGSVSSNISAGSSTKNEGQGDAPFISKIADETIRDIDRVGEEVPPVPQPMTLASLLSVDFEGPENVTSNGLEEELPVYSCKSPGAEGEGEVSAPAVNKVKPDIESLFFVASNIVDEQEFAANDRINAEARGKEMFVKNKDEKSLDVESGVSSSKREIFTSQQAVKASGKVKEFVKIFNQEPALKPTIKADANSRSNKLRERSVFEVNHDTEVSSTIKLDEIQTPDMSRKQVSGAHKPAMTQQPIVKNSDEVSKISSAQKNYSGQTNVSINEIFEASILNIDLEEILMLPEELEKPSAGSKHQEELEVSESKIMKWSKGKEGNIRALLSTLQYVLWPNSGWKPVALVDIIEGNAVKKAYQKALLCLHPDKLQQKGADSHNKYIAEKVLDMLQEAWDHFNTLGGPL